MVDEDFAWRLARDLVKIDSSDPGAYEGEIEHFIKRLVEERPAQLDSPALDAVQSEKLEMLVIAGKTGNRNCMSYGPGSLALAHKPNEYVPHADIVRCQNVLIALADNTLWDASGQVGA